MAKQGNLLSKTLVIGIIFLFIGMSITPSVAVDTVKKPTMLISNNTLYVGGTEEGNYTSIQDAIDNASGGNTIFVYNGTYYENIVIKKSINLIGEDRDTTVINGGGFGNVIDITVDLVNISGFTIQNSGGDSFNSGIRIGSDYNTISDNIIGSNNKNGITISWSNYNNISRNTIINNNDGISIDDSGYNNIFSNNITNNEKGISLNKFNWQSPETTKNNIYQNNIIHNDKGFYISFGVYPLHDNDICYNNFINNNQNAYDSSMIGMLNLWRRNYWDDWIGLRIRILRFLPYHIRGSLFKFDWRPAKEPYDI